MLKYFACLRGKHTYHVRVQPGRVFLECTCCSRRSPGWNLTAGSTTKAGEAFRLLLEESAIAETAPVDAPQPCDSRDCSEYLPAPNEFRLHLELSAAGWKRMDGDDDIRGLRLLPKMGQKLRKVFQVVGSDRPR